MFWGKRCEIFVLILSFSHRYISFGDALFSEECPLFKQFDEKLLS